MQPIPEHLKNSLPVSYVVSKGWNFQESGSDQIQVEFCPICAKGNYHFYVAHSGPKEGLWMCHSCQQTGNLRGLQEMQGDKIAGVESRKDWSREKKDKEDLPDPSACHLELLGDAEAMDYLVNVRGFTEEIIHQQKLGLKDEVYFHEAGTVRALVIPYLVNGNVVYAKYRTLPPSPKDFSCPKGWEAPLYNEEILAPGLKEIIFVEGEADALCMMSHGVTNVVGVPGAGMKKAAWVEKLDRVAPDKIFILFDNDKAGIKGSQELASRIGYDKCLRIALPAFEVEPGKPGKDISDWFNKGGGTAEKFRELIANAQLFDVTGVTRSGDALDALDAELAGKESLEPTYRTPWASLSKIIGWENGDVIDIIAPEKIGKTTFGMNVIEYEVEHYDEDGLIVCLEMTPARLARKWVCHVTGTDDSLGKTDEEKVAKLAALKAAIAVAREKAGSRKGDLYFAYPQRVKEPEDMYQLIRDCVRRYGVKWVMFDNIQLLCDMTLKNAAHRTIHLSQISKAFAKLAKDYGFKLIRILQPKRIGDGRLVTTDDVDGSSQIEKDCDCAITLHRGRVGDINKSTFEVAGYLETEASFDSKMLVTVGLSRYTCGGYVTLEFDGGTSTVREFNMAKRATMEAAKPSMGYEMRAESVMIPATTAAPVEAVSI